jgi:hypothetical protein
MSSGKMPIPDPYRQSSSEIQSKKKMNAVAELECEIHRPSQFGGKFSVATHVSKIILQPAIQPNETRFIS